MNVILFKKIERQTQLSQEQKPELSQEQKKFLDGAISALSYLETLSFKENLPLLQAGLKFAQLAATESHAHDGTHTPLKSQMDNILRTLLAGIA